MIEQGVAPYNILALTFTNKAAEQMRERIAQMLPNGRHRYIRMGTFHSVFSRILRDNADRIGFPQSFTIYEPSDCKNLLKTIVRELNLDDTKYKPAMLASRISYAKNCLVTPALIWPMPASEPKTGGCRFPSLAISITSIAPAASGTGRWISTTCCCRPIFCCGIVPM